MRIQPKKRLGQNFLIDQNIKNKIVNSLRLQPSDIVMEIGVGQGELTGLISKVVDKIYGLEIDKRLYALLNKSFKASENIQIINQDILKLNLAEFADLAKIDRPIKVFGNIPYYISSPIIEHLLKFRDKISAVFITVQKEFARRVVSLPGSKDYSSFSCFVQYYTEPKIIFDISRNCFKPRPKVDSSLMELRIRAREAVNVNDERLFFKIIRGAFNQRRKTLRNSLRGIVSGSALNEFFAKTGLDSRVRPERLTLENFALLANL